MKLKDVQVQLNAEKVRNLLSQKRIRQQNIYTHEKSDKKYRVRSFNDGVLNHNVQHPIEDHEQHPHLNSFEVEEIEEPENKKIVTTNQFLGIDFKQRCLSCACEECGGVQSYKNYKLSNTYIPEKQYVENLRESILVHKSHSGHFSIHTLQSCSSPKSSRVYDMKLSYLKCSVHNQLKPQQIVYQTPEIQEIKEHKSRPTTKQKTTQNLIRKNFLIKTPSLNHIFDKSRTEEYISTKRTIPLINIRNSVNRTPILCVPLHSYTETLGCQTDRLHQRTSHHIKRQSELQSRRIINSQRTQYQEVESSSLQKLHLQQIIDQLMNYIKFWKLKESQEIPEKDIEQQGFIGKFKQSFSLIKGEQIINKVQDVQQAATNWKNFAIFFSLGLCFLFLSLSFLPTLILFPSKFGGLFSLGSLCIIVSLYIIKGGKQFFKMFFNKEKIVYSSLYIVTLFGTIYFAIISKNYILVLIFSLFQLFSLIWLFASSFPAGITGMKFISKQIIGAGKSIISMAFKTQQSSFLPI